MANIAQSINVISPLMTTKNGLVKQLGDVVVVEVVDDAAPGSRAGHQPEVAQQPQLM